MDIQSLRAKAASLPLSPGVYIMHDSAGTIIYVGKARALKNRVSQYFHDLSAHTPKVLKMVEHVDDFEVIVAASEFDALVLENILIKKHLPKYNIKLKDDKGYPFIRLDLSEEYPRFTLASRKEPDGAHYFGPYGSRGMVNQVINTLSETLLLPTCSHIFPRDFRKNRPCLNAQMKRCIALCKGEISSEGYKKLLSEGELILRGDYQDLLSRLKDDMEDAAENMEFERAAVLRDRIYAVKRLGSRQIITQENFKDADTIAFSSDGEGGIIVLLSLRGGNVVGKFTLFTPDAREEDEEDLLSDFILQYYASDEADPPPALYLSSALSDREPIEDLLTQKAGRRVHLFAPKRGEKHALVDMALSNAREELLRRAKSEQHKTQTASALAEMLALPTPPSRIEAFDISNTGSDSIVAGMVVFESGKPRKSDYRKFKIKTTQGQDDFASMHEVLFRRLSDLQSGKKGFEIKPDLLLIDGGKGQLSAVGQAMAEAGIFIPAFGMEKDDRHRTRALVTPDGEEIGLEGIPAVFSFIGRIQEETHRYAIGFHRDLRDKKSIRTELDNIPGIGQTRRKALLTKFHSVKGVKSASLQDLAMVIGKSAAGQVYTYFHRKENEPT